MCTGVSSSLALARRSLPRSLCISIVYSSLLSLFSHVFARCGCRRFRTLRLSPCPTLCNRERGKGYVCTGVSSPLALARRSLPRSLRISIVYSSFLSLFSHVPAVAVFARCGCRLAQHYVGKNDVIMIMTYAYKDGRLRDNDVCGHGRTDET